MTSPRHPPAPRVARRKTGVPRGARGGRGRGTRTWAVSGGAVPPGAAGRHPVGSGRHLQSPPGSPPASSATVEVAAASPVESHRDTEAGAALPGGRWAEGNKGKTVSRSSRQPYRPRNVTRMSQGRDFFWTQYRPVQRACHGTQRKNIMKLLVLLNRSSYSVIPC